jgi:hypothetical protein
MSDLEQALDRVPITAVWEALGGKPLRFHRAPAIWRDTKDRNVALNDDKGTWYDHARGEGGGILDLIRRVRDGGRKDALRWLGDRFGIPLSEPRWTPEQRAEWSRQRRAAERAARPLAQCALWWLQERAAELNEMKRAAVRIDHIDVDALAFAARELCRLDNLTADDVLQEYLRHKQEHPSECAGLVLAGSVWGRACKAAVQAVLTSIEQEQRGTIHDAA